MDVEDILGGSLIMQPSRDNRKPIATSRATEDSFDGAQTEIDLKLVEALARIERVRSKALTALGTLIQTG